MAQIHYSSRFLLFICLDEIDRVRIYVIIWLQCNLKFYCTPWMHTHTSTMHMNDKYTVLYTKQCNAHKTTSVFLSLLYKMYIICLLCFVLLCFCSPNVCVLIVALLSLLIFACLTNEHNMKNKNTIFTYNNIILLYHSHIWLSNVQHSRKPNVYLWEKYTQASASAHMPKENQNKWVAKSK